MQITAQWDGIHIFWDVPNKSFCRRMGLQKVNIKGFLYIPKILKCTDVITFFLHLVMYLKIPKVLGKS